MIPVEGEGAKYWPRWRGPSGQGLAVGSGYVDTWSDTENVKWKTKLDTPGNGSPIVWANRIFLTTQRLTHKRGIAAFDRTTGRSCGRPTRRSGNQPSPKERLRVEHTDHRRPPGVRLSGPARRDRGRLRRAGSRGTRRSAPFRGNHGTAGSPLLYKDRVIVYQDQAGGKEGSLRRLTRRPARASGGRRVERVGWGTPIAILAGARDEIIVSSMRAVNAYNPDNGGCCGRSAAAS